MSNDPIIPKNWTASDGCATNGAVTCSSEEYWAVTATRIESQVCPPFIMAFGVIGNVLSFLVMSRKGLRNTSIGVYCMALAVSDSFVCNCMYPNIMYISIHNIALFQGIWSNIYLFLSFSSGHISAWLIVFITIDRFTCVTFPLKAIELCTPQKAKRIIAVIVCFFLVFDGIVFLGILEEEIFTEDFQMYVGRTEKMTSYLNFTWHLIDACLMNFIPSPIILVLNITIIIKLKRRRKNLTKMTGHQSAEIDRKIYVMLISVSTLFATLNIPYYTWTIYTGYLEHWKNEDFHETAKRAFMLLSFIHLYCLNHSINFYIYCLTGQKFRAGLKAVFMKLYYSFCRPKKDRLRGMSMSSRLFSLSQESTMRTSVSTSEELDIYKGTHM